MKLNESKLTEVELILWSIFNSQEFAITLKFPFNTEYVLKYLIHPLN